jgi:hypothetical protein
MDHLPIYLILPGVVDFIHDARMSWIVVEKKSQLSGK